MDDRAIVNLYWERDESAIAATKERYGAYLFRIAFYILSEPSDSEECVNDTYFGAWNSIPPQKPQVLQTYLGKLTRRIAIDRYRKNTAFKRGSHTVTLSIEELSECLPDNSSVEQKVESHRLSAAINGFLHELSQEKRRVFLMRYWYSMPIRDISALMGFRESKTVSMLSRTRKALKAYLEKEALLDGSE